MSSVEINTTGTEELRARFTEMAGSIRVNLRNAINASIIDMQAQVITKLSGPVLKTRTGRLRNSINTKLDEADTTITGSVGANMLTAKYAAAHEYGFAKTVVVREHLRMITQAFGRPLKTGPRQITVKSHDMDMNLPERSYLRSTLAENAPAIADRLREAVDETVAA